MIYVLVILMASLVTPCLAAPAVVILVRHAEKADGSTDTSLSARGKERAELLASMLRDSGVKAIFTSEFKRTKETASPLAKSIGVTAEELTIGLASQRDRILNVPGGVVLVVGHSNTIPELIMALGVKPEPKINDDDFGRMFVVVPSQAGESKMVVLRYGGQ
jgi:phosphohistidine phosphatase SixA